jgi:hypothetical protein
MPEESSAALESVTQAAFNGVLRALEARNMNIRQFPGPIIVGIVAWPELPQASQIGQQAGGSAGQG